MTLHARPGSRAVVPIIVDRLYGLPPLVVEDGLAMARFFFETDLSAVGDPSYDGWVAAGPRDRFVRHDIEVINRPMRARSPYAAWDPLLKAPSPAWLSDLGEHWDLVETPEADWSSWQCGQLLEIAIGKLAVKGVGRAMATKVLHMKRPRLVPILDSLVIQTLGGRTDEFPTPTAEVIAQIRRVAVRNGTALAQVRDGLDDLPGAPSLARVLDALLWTANPRSSLHAQLGWPTRLGPARNS